MIRSELKQKLAEYLLLNAPALANPSLSQGKASIALSLGIYGKGILNEGLVDEAGNLIMEVLLSPNNDYSFFSGWAGIGWGVATMIGNKLIEADYIDIMGPQHKHIISVITKLASDSLQLNIPETIGLLYYLSAYAQLGYTSELCLQDKLLKQIERTLTLGWRGKYASPTRTQLILSPSSLFDYYIKYCIFSQIRPSLDVLEAYAELYTGGTIPSNYSSGIYLRHISNDIYRYEDVSYKNISIGRKVLKTAPTLPFSRVLPALISLQIAQYSDKELELYLLKRIGLGQDLLEDKLLSSIQKHFPCLNITTELAKLLLYTSGRGDLIIF